MGFPLSLPVVIGFLMLMGIVTKNSILLVDFAFEKKRALDAFLQVVGPLSTSPAKLTITAPAPTPVTPPERPREAIEPTDRQAPRPEEP